MLGEPKLRREICFANTLLFVTGLFANHAGYLPMLDSHAPETNLLRVVFIGVGATSAGMWACLVVKTRRCFTEWKALFLMGVMFLLGLSLYFYVAIASMANPPVNWAYPRTVEGFLHVVTRGQYERLRPTDSLSLLAAQLRAFGGFGASDFGLFYAVAALIPVCFLHRMRSRDRGWMLGLVAGYLCRTLLMLIALNLLPEGRVLWATQSFFSASHLVLAICAGHGLVLLGTVLARPNTSPPPLA